MIDMPSDTKLFLNFVQQVKKDHPVKICDFHIAKKRMTIALTEDCKTISQDDLNDFIGLGLIFVDQGHRVLSMSMIIGTIELEVEMEVLRDLHKNSQESTKQVEKPGLRLVAGMEEGIVYLLACNHVTHAVARYMKLYEVDGPSAYKKIEDFEYDFQVCVLDTEKGVKVVYNKDHPATSTIHILHPTTLSEVTKFMGYNLR